MRRSSIHVTSDDIWLGLVALDVRRGPRVVDGIEHVKQLRDFVAAAEPGHRHDDPGGRVCVLSAVFANARRVAFDIPGFLCRAIERRIEQQEQP